jgi:hypothetical protein
MWTTSLLEMTYPGVDNYLTCTDYAAAFAISPSFGSGAGALENPFTAHPGLVHSACFGTVAHVTPLPNDTTNGASHVGELK